MFLLENPTRENQIFWKPLVYCRMQNTELYMSVEEQKQAFLAAGFTRVDEVLIKGGLVLHRAT